MLRLLFVIVMLNFPGCLVAQKKVMYDTATISSRQFSSSAMQKFRTDPSFNYVSVGEPAKSLWQRFWEWLWGNVFRMLETENGWNIFKIIIIVISSAILLYFVLKLSGMTGGRLMGKESRGNEQRYSVSGEDIHAIPFEKAIEDAVAAGNYRLAVRLLYLQTLKKLADGGLINWQIDKTNIAFLNELTGHRLFMPFRELTFQFEKNWYGDLPIREDEFYGVKKKFSDFNQQIN